MREKVGWGCCIHGVRWGGPRCEECDVAVDGKPLEGHTYEVPETAPCICKMDKGGCRGHKYNCRLKQQSAAHGEGDMK